MTNTKEVSVIAIDGPTASGKGTIASRVAEQLGFHYLDSGALYRLTAYACLKHGVALDDEAACAREARGLRAVFTGGRILLEDEDVTEAIRREEVGVAASRVAMLPAVREALLSVQRDARKAPGIVADGRDMAYVVFPDAGLKVFLTATPSARAQRRYKQLIDKGISANLCDLTRDLAERDRRDRERAAAPCLPAHDAHILDNSGLTVEETVEVILAWWRKAEKAKA